MPPRHDVSGYDERAAELPTAVLAIACFLPKRLANQTSAYPCISQLISRVIERRRILHESFLRAATFLPGPCRHPLYTLGVGASLVAEPGVRDAPGTIGSSADSWYCRSARFRQPTSDLPTLGRSQSTQGEGRRRPIHLGDRFFDLYRIEPSDCDRPPSVSARVCHHGRVAGRVPAAPALGASGQIAGMPAIRKY
jgi:hypothetical protein